MSRVGLYAPEGLSAMMSREQREHRAATRRYLAARKRNARREPITDAPEPVELLDLGTDEFLKEAGW